MTKTEAKAKNIRYTTSVEKVSPHVTFDILLPTDLERRHKCKSHLDATDQSTILSLTASFLLNKSVLMIQVNSW